ncbi:MarR family winged helix-turn-helix transcriptional regulator [Zavarzinia sp.]|uniref:MarR family winged helix-turn-helix transcriptional regulator n=1 Tax=Zavarzinia sp. TaxID=2027920 RepID=UPI0035653EB9
MKQETATPPADTFGFQITLTMRAWRRMLDEAFAGHGLSEATWRPLIHIYTLGEGLHQNHLAASLGIEGPSLVRLLDNLETAGLIERRADAADRRAKTLHLTPAGRELAELIKDEAYGLHRRLLAGVSAEEIEHCLRVFAKVQENVAAALPKRGRRRAGGAP